MQNYHTDSRHRRLFLMGSVIAGFVSFAATHGCGFLSEPCAGGGVNQLTIICPCADDAECDDGNECTADLCGPPGANFCLNVPLCDLEHCVETVNGFACVECLADSECADNDPCTADSCTDRICTFQPFACDDEAP